MLLQVFQGFCAEFIRMFSIALPPAVISSFSVIHEVSSYFKSQQQQSPIMCKALSCLRAHSFPLILQYNGSFLVPFSPIPQKGEKFCNRICINPLIFCSLISYNEAALI